MVIKLVKKITTNRAMKFGGNIIEFEFFKGKKFCLQISDLK